MERVTHSWRASVACHAPARAVTPNDDERDLTLAAAAPIEADVAGMGLLIAPDGEAVVLDVTGISVLAGAAVGVRAGPDRARDEHL
jgi:hypothetical protein